MSVDQAGSERTEAWESALPAEESPRPGRAKRRLWEIFTRGYHRLHYGCRRRKITQLAVFLNPRPPPELPPGLPAPIRRSCRRRGGHCVARPSYHSAGARDREDRITWRCATIRLVSSLLRAASPTILLRGGASERESRDRGIGNLLGDFGSPWTEVNGVWVRGGRRLHNSDKKFALTMGADAEAWRRGPGVGRGARAGERERGSFPGNMPKWIHKNFIRTQMRKRSRSNIRECEENVEISFSKKI